MKARRVSRRSDLDRFYLDAFIAAQSEYDRAVCEAGSAAVRGKHAKQDMEAARSRYREVAADQSLLPGERFPLGRAVMVDATGLVGLATVARLEASPSSRVIGRYAAGDLLVTRGGADPETGEPEVGAVAVPFDDAVAAALAVGARWASAT